MWLKSLELNNHPKALQFNWYFLSFPCFIKFTPLSKTSFLRSRIAVLLLTFLYIMLKGFLENSSFKLNGRP